ncbi:MAG: hypothetical protein JXB38_09020 [Anaerolineales bacterium]|nr:hypothetical protein [Anaerolineales bacterium]
MSKERTAFTFIIVLPLIMLIGSFKMARLPSPKAQHWEETRFWMLKTHRTDTFDVVLIGDSRMYQGLSPAAMQTVLKNSSVLNLGYLSGGLNPEIYALAEQRLSPTNSQPVIVLGITPLALTPLAEQNAQYHQYLGKSRLERYFMTHLTPVLVFFAPITPETLFEYLQIVPTREENIMIQKYHDDGWSASHYLKDDPNASWLTYHNIFIDNQVSEELVQELIAQTKTWTQADILVFGFRFPSTEQIATIEDEQSGFDEAALKAAFVKSGGIWINVPASAYRSYDGSHLHKAGALEFSVDLAKHIQEYLDTPAN